MPSKIKLIPQMQIGFWTPSPDFIADNGLIIRKGTFGSYQTTQEQRGNEWQNITPQKIDTFSTQLFLKYEVRGRRYEHYGLGEDSRKPGYWWVLSVDQKFDLESFAKWYVEFFQATKLDRKTDTKVPYKLYIEKYNIENGRIEPSL